MLVYIKQNFPAMQKNSWLPLLILALFLSSCSRYHDGARIEPIIDESRLRTIIIDPEGKQSVKILDTYEDSIRKILKDLRQQNFKIFEIYSYTARNKTDNSKPSLHAYAAAIDINPGQNPYYNAVTKARLSGTNEEGYEDYFLNRNVIRPGMITERQIETFVKNGFTIWGGMWRQPMDYMHFQTTKAIAKIVAHLNSKEAKIFWNAYLKNPKKTSEDPFFAGDIDPDMYSLKDFLKKIEYILKSVRG